MTETQRTRDAWAVQASRTAAYHRPDWMTDPVWQQVSAELTEYWMLLLERAARG